MRFFGSSGIRGVVNNALFELAFKIGLAVGSAYGNVVVGTDTRTSADALKYAVISGLLSAGSKTTDIGIVPTPTLAFAARHFSAGVMITASHNPPEYNGIKLWNPDGSSFSIAQQEQIEERILSDSLKIAPWTDMERNNVRTGLIEEHIERIVRDFPGQLGLKVVLDCGCGAASLVTPYLLRRLGCEVLALNSYPSGFFPRGVEPTESNLTDLVKMTREFGAGLGIAHDGDADRMVAIDDQGRLISGDKLLVILARAVNAKEVVTTLDASMIIDEAGFKVRRTRVGDSYVSEELKRGGHFGGESSGAWIFPNISFCPDGIYAAAQVAVIASQQKLSEIADGIASYPILRGSIDSRGIAIPVLDSALASLKPLSLSRIDGIRLGFNDGWVLVRASGTEPKIRLTAEARSERQVRELYESTLNTVQSIKRE